MQYSTRGDGVIPETNSNEHPRLDSVSESRLKSNLVSASKFTTVYHPQQLQCSNHPVSLQFKFQCSTGGGGVSTGTNSNEHPRLDSVSDSRFSINITKSNSLRNHNFICSSLVKPVSIVNVCEPLKNNINVITTNDVNT